MSDQERQPCLQGVPSERERFGGFSGDSSPGFPRRTGDARHLFDPSLADVRRCVYCSQEEGSPVHKEAS